MEVPSVCEGSSDQHGSISSCVRADDSARTLRWPVREVQGSCPVFRISAARDNKDQPILKLPVPSAGTRPVAPGCRSVPIFLIRPLISRDWRPGGRYQFCKEIHDRKGEIADATCQAVADRFGERGVMDLIVLTGCYTMLAMVLNVTRQPLPDGAVPPLAALK